MGPQSPAPDMFRPRLDEQINMKHPLVRLAELIGWDEIHRSFAGYFCTSSVQPYRGIAARESSADSAPSAAADSSGSC